VYRAEIFGEDTSLVVLARPKISEFYLAPNLSDDVLKLSKKRRFWPNWMINNLPKGSSFVPVKRNVVRTD
jgi:hypothetical protein